MDSESNNDEEQLVQQQEPENHSTVQVTEENDLLAPPCKKRKLENRNTAQDDRIEERLTEIFCCVVCLELPKTPIYQCRMGHLMCVSCFTHLLSNARLRNQLAATCPNCRVSISWNSATRNLAVEKAVSELPSACQLCNEVLPSKFMKRHETLECQERPTDCKYSRIGCEWRGPNKEVNEHEHTCLHQFKSADEIMTAVEEKEKEICFTFSSVTDFLSHKSLLHIDLQMAHCHSGDYRSDYFEAFAHEWLVKARINDGDRDLHLSNKRTMSYQLILITTAIAPMRIRFFVLKGPISDMKVSIQIYEHNFMEQSSESDYYLLPLCDSLECNRLLSHAAINFRLFMALVNE